MAKPDRVATSQTHRVYEDLRANVIAGQLRPNERLNIAALAEQNSSSPGAVRESLSRLTAEGLVIAEPQRGFKVAPVSLSDLRDLTRTRIEIETLCLLRALDCGDLGWESRVVAAHHRLSQTPIKGSRAKRGFNIAWVAAHSEFHGALVSACDSAWLLRLRDMLFAQSERYRELCFAIDRGMRNVEDEHRALMEAALAREKPKIALLCKSHLEITTEIIERAIKAGKLVDIFQ